MNYAEVLTRIMIVFSIRASKIPYWLDVFRLWFIVANLVISILMHGAFVYAHRDRIGDSGIAVAFISIAFLCIVKIIIFFKFRDDVNEKYDEMLVDGYEKLPEYSAKCFRYSRIFFTILSISGTFWNILPLILGARIMPTPTILPFSFENDSTYYLLLLYCSFSVYLLLYVQAACDGLFMILSSRVYCKVDQIIKFLKDFRQTTETNFHDPTGVDLYPTFHRDHTACLK